VTAEGTDRWRAHFAFFNELRATRSFDDGAAIGHRWSVSSALFQPFPMLPGRAAQVWRHQPAYRRPRHFHEEPELNVVVRGRATLGVGHRSLELGAGELVLLEPGQDHVLLEASPDLELFVLALRPSLAERVRGSRPSVLKDKLVLSESEAAALRELAVALGAVSDACAVERTLAELFASIGSRPCTSHVSSRRAVVQLRSAPGISAAEVARRLRTAPAQVSREFHRDLGLTLVEFRARLRLMRFVRLVDAGATLSAAAFEADFGSYAQCHRAFQRALGCSPRDYFRGARCAVEAATEPELFT
jgi:AraC-like DNA-binding protein/mannose-6-phosphate isomerase-like protein (cupin superfamily)